MSVTPAAATSAVRRTSLAEVAFSALLGSGGKAPVAKAAGAGGAGGHPLSTSTGGAGAAASLKSPAVGEKERRAAELAAILVANGELKATAGPSIVLTEGQSVSNPRQPASSSSRHPSTLGPMSSLSSDSLSGLTVNVGGHAVDVATLARRAAGGGAGAGGARESDADAAAAMMGDVLREMGAKMVALNGQMEGVSREARVAGAARDDAVAKLGWVQLALDKATGEAERWATEARRTTREADDAVGKMAALEQMAEMASGVKLALAQRLEAAMGEAADMGEQLEAVQAELKRVQEREAGLLAAMQRGGGGGGGDAHASDGVVPRAPPEGGGGAVQVPPFHAAMEVDAAEDGVEARQDTVPETAWQQGAVRVERGEEAAVPSSDQVAGGAAHAEDPFAF